MRRTTISNQSLWGRGLPRGWIVLAMALASWIVLTALLAGLNQLFLLVQSAL